MWNNTYMESKNSFSEPFLVCLSEKLNAGPQDGEQAQIKYSLNW